MSLCVRCANRNHAHSKYSENSPEVKRGERRVGDLAECGWLTMDRQPRDCPHRGPRRVVNPNPRVNLDEDGTLDDFAAEDVKLVHFEALDDTRWYATITLASGEMWQLNFGARDPRARGYARAEQVQP